jgi:tetratricopeptide (TPR) repeat protein
MAPAEQGRPAEQAPDSSPSGKISSATGNPRVVKQLEAYCVALEKGEKPNRDELLALFPEVAGDLSECLDALEFVHQVIPQARQQLEDATGEKAVASGPQAVGTLGDFRIVREIGRGGMGVVYEAEQVSLGRKVALKVLPFAAVLDPKQLQRFKNEAQAAAQLHHQNIVPVFFVGCERGVHFYAMQYVEGQTLAQVIRDLRRLEAPEDEAPDEEDQPGLNVAEALTSGRYESPKRVANGDAPTAAHVAELTPAVAPPEAKETAPVEAISTDRSTKSRAYFRSVAGLGIQVAEALDHAHEHGVIHRDVKPSNLIVDAQGKAWIMDFGLARIESGATVTISGDLLGTVRYMSPEQALAKRITVDHRTDVYSLGVTLYELLTLQPVFTGHDREELLRQIAFEEPKAPRRLNNAIPVELETIILKAMAKNPAERYDTAQDFADDLDRFLDDKPIHARRPTLADRMAKWARRHRPVVWAAAATFLIALVALATSTALIAGAYQREKKQREIAVEQKRIAVSQERLAKEQQRLAELAAKREKELRTEAERQRERAEANLRLALEALDEVYLRVTQRRGTEGAQPKNEEAALLHSTLKFYERFADANRTVPATRPLVEDVYGEILTIRKDLVEQSPHVVGYRRALAAATVGLAALFQGAGRTPEARETYEQAVRIQEQLVKSFPTVREYRTDLASSHNRLVNLLESAGKDIAASRHLHEFQRLDSVAESSDPSSVTAIRFSDFADAVGLELLGDASIIVGRIRLSPGKRAARGTAWLAEKQLVAFGFETTFEFEMTDGGEGLAFVIQNHEICGPFGGYGYEMPNSLATEFDTWPHPKHGDPPGDHASIQTNGIFKNTVKHWHSLGAVVVPSDLDDEKPHRARIRYVPGTLELFLDGSGEPLLTTHVDLASTLELDEGRAWVGFAGGSGGTFQMQDILSWEFRPLVDQETADKWAKVFGPKPGQEIPRGATPGPRVESQPAGQLANNNTVILGENELGPLPKLNVRAKDLPFLKKAVAFYETFAEQNRDDPNAQWKIAKAYWQVAEIQKSLEQDKAADRTLQIAIQILEDLADIVPEDRDTRLYFSEVYRSQGHEAWTLKRYDQALAHYARAIELGPEYSIPYLERAVVYLSARQHDSALADLNAYLHLNPRSAHGYGVRAMLFLQLKQYDKALVDSNKSVKLKPDWYSGYEIRAKANLALNKYRQALSDLERAVELNPDNLGARGWLSWFLVACPNPELRDADRAAELASCLVEEAPDRQDYWRDLGMAQYRKGDWRAARVSLVKSGHSEFRIFLAMTEWQLGNKAAAYSHYVRFAMDAENVPESDLYHATFRSLLAEAAQLMSLSDAPSIDAVLDKAIAEVEQLVASSPNDADIRRNLAHLYRQRGDRYQAGKLYDKALADYGLAIQLVTDDPAAYVARAKVHSARKDHVAAVVDCSRAVELNPDNSDAYYSRALAYWNLEEYEKALEDWSSCIKLDPQSDHLHCLRARTFLALGRRGEALPDFERAVALAPENCDANAWLAVLLVTRPDDRLWDVDRAIDLARKAIKIHPKSIVASFGLGVAQYRKGDWQAARESLGESLDLGNLGQLHERWVFLAMVDWQLGNKAGAYDYYIKFAEHIEKNAPDDQDYRRFLREAADLMGLSDAASVDAVFEKAIGEVEELVANSPDDADGCKGLADLYFARGTRYYSQSEFEKAFKDMSEAIPLDPDNALHLNNLAWFLATCADSAFWDADRAVELAEKAVQLSPEVGSYWNTLGTAYYRAGNWDKAIETLNRSIELGSGGTSYDFFFLAMAHWQRGERDEGRSWYQEAVEWMDEKKPSDEELLRFRAEAAELLGITETPPEAKVQEQDQN